MTDQANLERPALPAPGETSAESAEKTSSGLSAVKASIIVFAGIGIVILLIFLFALGAALFAPENAPRFQIIRDFFIIVMALEGIVIGAALVVLVLQLARLTNLLQNEVKPILEQASETVKTVQGTATFVSRNVAAPVIRFTGLFTFIMAFLRELFGIRRAVRHAERQSKTK